MIIHRLANAIRHQNWSQIITEILIVVIGIFLGLQVDDWNTQREDRVQEGIYLERLHTEVTDAIDFREETFEGVVFTRDVVDFNQGLGEILAVFKGTDLETTLGPRHCFAVMGSHIYNDQSVDIPTLRELNASGLLSLIQNEDIKIAISQFAFSMEGMLSLVNGLTPTALVLARKYPNLISLDLGMRDIQARDEFNHQCDFEKMRDNKAFINDLVDNATRMNAFSSTAKKVEGFLDAVHVELDKELGRAH